MLYDGGIQAHVLRMNTREEGPDLCKIVYHTSQITHYTPYNIQQTTHTIYHESYIRDWMNMILKECDFKRRYTIYSLRSTHISYALLNGQSVNKVSKNVGTSMEMIQKTYDGLSARYSIDDLGFFKDTNVPKEEDI